MEYLSTIGFGMYGDRAWEILQRLCDKIRDSGITTSQKRYMCMCVSPYRAPDGEVCIKFEYNSIWFEYKFYCTEWPDLDRNSARQKLVSMFRQVVDSVKRDSLDERRIGAFISMADGFPDALVPMAADLRGEPADEVQTQLETVYRKEQSRVFALADMKLTDLGSYLKFGLRGEYTDDVFRMIRHDGLDGNPRIMKIIDELKDSLRVLAEKYGRPDGGLAFARYAPKRMTATEDILAGLGGVKAALPRSGV